MIDRALLEKMFASGFQDGLEKQAGGLQTIGKAILKLRALQKAGKIGTQATRLKGLEAKLLQKVGPEGMKSFEQGGVKALRGTKGEAIKGVPKGTGTSAKARKSSKAGYQAAEAQRGVKAEAYTAKKGGKGVKEGKPKVSDAKMQQAKQGQRAAYAEGMQASGVQPAGLPGTAAAAGAPAALPGAGFIPARIAPVGMPAAPVAGAAAPATAAGINQRVAQNRMSRYGGKGQGQGGFGGFWQGVQNTVKQPGFWPAAGIGAAAGAGAVGLGAALGS